MCYKESKAHAWWCFESKGDGCWFGVWCFDWSGGDVVIVVTQHVRVGGGSQEHAYAHGARVGPDKRGHRAGRRALPLPSLSLPQDHGLMHWQQLWLVLMPHAHAPCPMPHAHHTLPAHVME